MNGNPIDFSSIGGKPVAPDSAVASAAASTGGTPSTGAIDFSSIGGRPVAPENPYPISDEDKGAGPGLRNVGTGLLSLPGHIFSAFTDEPKDDAELASGATLAAMYHVPLSVGMAMHRLVAAPMAKSSETADAYAAIAANHAEKFGDPGTTGHPWWDQTLGRFLEFGGSKDEQQQAANDAQHKANMHRIASIAPLLGPQSADVMEHFMQGDPSGAVTELLGNIGVGKLTESLTKLAAKNIAKVAPKMGSVAGESVPIMAGQEKGAAPIARRVAVTPNPESEVATQQQSAAQRGVANEATDAMNRQMDKFAQPGAGEEGDVEVIPPKTDDRFEEYQASRAAAAGAGAPGPTPAGTKFAWETSDGQTTNTESQPEIPDRRVNAAQRKAIDEMSPEEKNAEISALRKERLASKIPGIRNRTAFDEAPNSPAVAMSDADGLKAFNDRYGYEAGNALLKAKADSLKEAGLDAYHNQGDEFVYRGESPADLQTKLENARNIFRNKPISFTIDGKVLNFKGADFSYGTGQDLAEAESGLKAHKSTREAAGERARGEFRGFDEAGSGQGQPNNDRQYNGQAPAQKALTPGSTLATTPGSALAPPEQAITKAGSVPSSTPGPEVIPPQRGAGSGAPVSGGSPTTINGNMPSSEPVTRGTAKSFGDAAAQVEGVAQRTFKKLDQLSDGAYSTLQNKLEMATKAERRATNVPDMEAATKARLDAEKAVNDLIDKHSSQFLPDELKNAKSAWRDKVVMEDIHGYVEKAFSAPDSVAGKSKLVSRTLDGAKLTGQLNQMVSKIPEEDLTRVLGSDGVKNLYEIARIAGDPAGALKVGSALDEIGGYVGKTAHTPGLVRDTIARSLATKPRVSNMLINALKFGTNAKIYGPLIADEINKSSDDSDTSQAQKISDEIKK
jgi:GGDEF domain-containing protein